MSKEDAEKLKKAAKKAPKESAAAKKRKLDVARDTAKGKITGSTSGKLDTLRVKGEAERFSEGIDNVKKLREKIKSAPIGLIEKIEDRYPGMTLAAFTTTLKDKFKLDPKNWSSEKIYSKFKANTKIGIDFLGNQDAEGKWGWADMAKIDWRGMTKYEGGSTSMKRVSLRRVGLKGQNKSNRGCYDRRGYMAIHTKDDVMYHNVDNTFKTQFREKQGTKYLEINAKSYEKYSNSKYASEDKKFMEKHRKTWSFISRRPKISNAEILAIRKKIGGLEGLSVEDRIVKVAKYIAQPGNMIRANHCGDWVDRIYAIAGVKRKKGIYPPNRSALAYAFVDNNPKKGWKPKKNPDGSWNQKRYDARISGLHAKKHDWKKIKVGDWLWVNNRNKYDYAGNHSGIFLGWKDKAAGIGIMANWYKNTPGKQKIVTYNFNKIPVVHISRMTEIDDSLPDEGGTPDVEYQRVPDVDESEARAMRDSEWKAEYRRGSEKETKKAFIKQATKFAKKACRGTKLNWRVMLAQTITETGWGWNKGRILRNENYFGMKAHHIKTQRDRAYKSMYESFMDYRHKMLSTPNYKDALDYADNPLMAIAIILANGYCPNPEYFKTILGVWKQSKYGTAIGIPSVGYIHEAKLRQKLMASTYFTNNTDIPDKEKYIKEAIIEPAKAANRWRQ